MGFIVNGLIKKPVLSTYNVYMFANLTIYNPIIGSNIGIPLNILQYIFTTTYYDKNILTDKLILLQFAIGIFTYGSDRLFDAIDYNSMVNKSIVYSIDKINYYDYLISTINYNIFLIISSYIYIFYILNHNQETYPLLYVLTSTLFYRDFKKNFGELKPLYIGIYWTFGCVILPCVLYDNNYDILLHPSIYIPSILLMFSTSNMLDIKDIDEDRKNGINTLAVKFGKFNSELISNSCYIIGLVIYLTNFT
tara:strand:+ start:6168 stop:6917 length:750 start_codon:yes stop_codon:yes gene_type:complete